MRWVRFFWAAPWSNLGDLQLVVKDSAMNGYCGIQRTMTSYTKRCIRMRRVYWCKFGRNPMKSFCLICVVVSLSWIPRHKAFSLILLVSPYTLLTQTLNCLFVSPYMKMMRHALILVIQVTSHKTDVANYVRSFPVRISNSTPPRLTLWVFLDFSVWWSKICTLVTPYFFGSR